MNINEQVAIRIGFEWARPEPQRRPDSYCWMYQGKEVSIRIIDAKPRVDLLPNFSGDWNDTKILIRWMRGRGWEYEIKPYDMINYRFYWWNAVLDEIHTIFHHTEIQDDNLPFAACEAFLQIPDKELEVE